VTEKRTKMITARLKPSQVEKLERIAAQMGVNRNHAIAVLIESAKEITQPSAVIELPDGGKRESTTNH
jgi:uncharacterized protein (DUF1778 family)